jgi:hypothetical protein
MGVHVPLLEPTLPGLASEYEYINQHIDNDIPMTLNHLDEMISQYRGLVQEGLIQA